MESSLRVHHALQSPFHLKCPARKRVSYSGPVCHVITTKALRSACVGLTCAVGIMSCCWKMNAMAFTPMEMHQKAPPSFTPEYQVGASKALKSFLDVSIKLASPEMTELSSDGDFLLLPTSVADVDALIKTMAVQKIRVGKAEVAVERLEQVFEALKANQEIEIAYHVDMVLVEVLIYLGRYEEALKRECLQEDQRIPFDGRFPLYKAMLCTMLNKEEARYWWDEFLDTVGGHIDPMMM